MIARDWYKFTRIMSFLRSPSSFRFLTAASKPSYSSRFLSYTSRRSLGEPDPKAIPDVDAMHMTEDQASMVVADIQPRKTIEELRGKNQPDYTATVDYATSNFSPVPKRVMNGSEPTEVTPAAVLSGAPVDLQARTVR